MFFRKKKKRWDPNKVTPLSKGIALVLFIALPFIGFYFGTRFQKVRDMITVDTLRTEILKLEIENEVLKSVK